MTRFYDHDSLEKLRPKGPRPGFPKEDEGLAAMMNIYLKDRNLNIGIARSNGWYPTMELDIHPRIVIPCSNSANVSYFQARSMNDGLPRYKSLSATREDSLAVVWSGERGSAYFGLDIKGSVIVEGPMDALAAAYWGYTGIALMGNDPPEEVFDYLSTVVRPLGRVIVIPDKDHLEMGSTVVVELGLRGVVETTMVLPTAKDFAEMRIVERGRLLEAA